jgi:hypothetical protein
MLVQRIAVTILVISGLVIAATILTDLVRVIRWSLSESN